VRSFSNGLRVVHLEFQGFLCVMSRPCPQEKALYRSLTSEKLGWWCVAPEEQKLARSLAELRAPGSRSLSCVAESMAMPLSSASKFRRPKPAGKVPAVLVPMWRFLFIPPVRVSFTLGWPRQADGNDSNHPLWEAHRGSGRAYGDASNWAYGTHLKAECWRYPALLSRGRLVHGQLARSACPLVYCARCRIEPHLDQGGAAARRRGPASAPRSALGGPRGARRATPQATPDQHGPSVTQGGMHAPGRARAAAPSAAWRVAAPKPGPDPTASVFPGGLPPPGPPAPRGSGRPRCFNSLPACAARAFLGRAALRASALR